MTRPLLPAFFIVVGKDERLTIVADALGMPGALRFRSRQHAEDWLTKHEADSQHGRTKRDFGPGATV